jgi:3-methyladenine DNA glycosylase AlkD
MSSLPTIKRELRKYASDPRKKQNEWFFKTDDGCYGAHDKFIGVRVPDTRKVAKEFADTPLPTLKKLLASEIHEERLLALIILTLQYKSGSDADRKKVYKFYIQNKKQVNNWDLVDVSAPNVVGEYLLANPSTRDILDKLVTSKVLWDRRIAMVAMWTFIRAEKLALPLQLAKKLLGDHEDLMHKAVGWMLREAWKKDSAKVEKFLKTNYKKLPRTTLRYAIERVKPETRRKKMLQGEF